MPSNEDVVRAFEKLGECFRDFLEADRQVFRRLMGNDRHPDRMHITIQPEDVRKIGPRVKRD